MPKQTALQIVNEINDKDILRNFLSDVSEEMLSKPNCKLCNSKYRREAESKYLENRKSIRVTVNFLKEKGEEVSYSGVRNHLLRHCVAEDRIERTQEYAADLSLWIGRNIDTRQRLVERIVMLERAMITLGALAEDENLDNYRKNIELMKKLSDGISILEDKLESMDRQMEPVELIIEKLKDVVRIKVQKVKTIAERTAVLSVMEDLSEQLPNMLIEA